MTWKSSISENIMAANNNKKVSKQVFDRRINDITRLLVAGGEQAEVKQLATEQNWGVTSRQIKRYINLAYRRMAKLSAREKEQLRGRHLAQRRALYARCVKNNDLRGALAAVKDEANLQGLYESCEGEFVDRNKVNENAAGRSLAKPVLPLLDRTIRLIAALSRKDESGVTIIESISPVYHARIPDISFARSIIPCQGAEYLLRQFEYLINFFFYSWMSTRELDPQTHSAINVLIEQQCYQYRLTKEAFVQYTKDLGIDPDYLIKGNYSGDVFEMFEEYILEFAPTDHQFNATREIEGFTRLDFPPVEYYVEKLHQDLERRVGIHDRCSRRKDAKH